GELGGAGVLVGDEALGEGAALDVREDSLHVLLDPRIDHARTRDVVAVLSGVGDRPALLGDAALDHQVDDELELVEALEVGHLGLVAGLDEGFEAVHDQQRRPPHRTACSPNRSVSVSSVKLCLMPPARRPPIARAYDLASSQALPLSSFSTATSTGTPRPSTYSRRTRWPGPLGATMATSTPG